MRYFIYCLFIACLLFGCKKQSNEVYIFKVSLLVNDSHTDYAAFEYFNTILKERSNNRLALEIYHSEQLAKEIEAIRLIQAEVIDMTITGSLLNNWFETAAFCELPFFFKDTVEVKQFIKGDIGQLVEQEMIEKTALRPLCYFLRGPRQLTSNKPIKDPDDLNGLIVRVPNVPSFVTTWDALGAKSTPMAFSEVFTSLQSGTVDAQENSLALIKNAGFYEVQKYVNMTNHVLSWGYPVIGEKQFQKLPSELQSILIEAAKDMQVFEHQLFLNHEKNIRKELENKGMQFISVNHEAFSKKCEQAIFESLSFELQSIYKTLKSKKHLE
ncbi:TRAP transporter substrate-binding protein [Tamlana fucoidanivorans]|uniref:TRAP transporter substrate-binding protein n=1 Tax=Allotamlana fucoidanivorans TaxID=2583814 RepID=A0A5C4SQN6_9FLAO|nr:TRAP transporter substrate-binding protein [Tamlana fucoidanivorans]TNJ46592.1 TRAP transporter substrate-binding protein [Tamlana fucoidanivorans]